MTPLRLNYFVFILSSPLFLRWIYFARRENQSIKTRVYFEENGKDENPPRSPVVKGENPGSDEITVVTAYFQLKPFKKATFVTFTPNTYKTWMKVFATIKNHMVIYVDTEENFNLFRKLREHFGPNRTKLFQVERSQLWSFQLKDSIKRIYDQPNYPQHTPNTMVPEYSCAMHAKFELMANATMANYFNTKYFSWLDIGLFRDIVSQKEEFTLTLPENFNEGAVHYSEISPYNRALTPWEIIAENQVWVGGACFLGRLDVILQYTEEYKKTVISLIERGMMSTDQQVIYAMFHPSLNIQPRTRIQVYSSGSGNEWFLLGYLSRERSAKRIRSALSTKHYMLSQV